MCYCCALLLSFHSFIFPASLLLMLTTVLCCCLSSTCRLNKMLIFPTRFFIFSFIRCCFFRVLFVAIHTPTQTVLLVSLDFTSRHLLMYKKKRKGERKSKAFFIIKSFVIRTRLANIWTWEKWKYFNNKMTVNIICCARQLNHNFITANKKKRRKKATKVDNQGTTQNEWTREKTTIQKKLWPHHRCRARANWRFQR